MQGVFELAGIPIIGCGVLASALCMDKDKAHKIAASAGINVPRSFKAGVHSDPRWIHSKASEIGYPLFVKPVDAGSSFGITKVSEPSALLHAIAHALKFDSTAIIEEAITSFKVGCAIIGTDELTIGVVDEVELPEESFLDIEEKYGKRTAVIHTPARIDEATADRIKNTAVMIYRALGCAGFARIDMFLTPEGRSVFNEVNTIPGMTRMSRFPRMLEAAGISLSETVEAILKMP